MIVLPIGDENPRIRIPFVHYAIIAANCLVFIYMMMLPDSAQEQFIATYGIVKSSFHWPQLFTSMFLHAGPLHIFFNMLFLWIVGDNVEDRLGHLGYLLFYLVVGVAGGIMFLAFVTPESTHLPCVGASGAISGVIAAYLVFFPNARIKIFYLFWFLFNVIYVSAKWAIGLWFAQQLLMFLIFGSNTGTAFEAHLGGFFLGLLLAFAIRPFLKPVDHLGRILTPDESPDAWGPSSPHHDRFGWPSAPASENLGWPQSSGASRESRPASSPPQARVIEEPSQPPPLPDSEPLPASGLQSDLASALSAGNSDEAFRLYQRLTSFRRESLPPEVLLLLANLLVDRSQYDRASRVYDDYLRHYPRADQAPEAAFRLGMIHARSTHDYVRAYTCLQRAAADHPSPTRRARAADEIRRVDSLLRNTFVGKSRPEGFCSLIRSTDRAIPVADVAPVVARATAEPLPDVSRRLAASRGFIAQNLPAPKAFRLAQEIHDLGVAVLVIPDSDVVPLADPLAVRVVHLAPAGVQFDLAADRRVVLPWDKLDLLSVGLIPRNHKVSHPIDRPTRAYGLSGYAAIVPGLNESLSPDEIVTSEETDYFVVDFFALSETPPLHLRAVQPDFSWRTDDGSSHGSRARQFSLFLNTIFLHAPDLAANLGAHREAASDSSSRRDYTFTTPQDFNLYNRWLLTLNRSMPATRFPRQD